MFNARCARLPRLSLALTIAAACAAAQAPSPDPDHFAALGAAYDTSVRPGRAAGWISYEVRIANGYYSVTTVNQTQAGSSLRTGFAKQIASNADARLFAFVDAGVITGSTNSSPATALGSFSGGGVLIYNLGSLFSGLKNRGFYSVLAVRMLKISSGATKPVYEFGFGRSF